ncbi:kinesin-like protein KIN-10C [Canna indica]|uniref:Kinesin-like protein n=1 Tax=Canna indica TaxID=4628 RepID=A0AAQ3QN09_9LILI|nr:kinesin-like protein KIN-10C [Canna indica]
MANQASNSVKHSSFTASTPTQSPVRVVLRVRPFLPLEIESNSAEPRSIPCIALLDPDRGVGEEVTVQLKDQWSSRTECYKLDSFFGQGDYLGQIFNSEVGSVIPGVFRGLNATVFAYGATGSGKTYTMQARLQSTYNFLLILFRVIPLAMSAILSSCKDMEGYSVEIAYYEIYMDRCYDLLEPKAKEIMAMDDRDGRVQLKGLSWVPVNSMNEFNGVFDTGVQRRKVARTGLNDVSSRSHAVLSIAVTNGMVKGKLNLIDLAGNEDNRRTCNEGIRLQESAKINQSLFALSNVIYALNNNEPRIPYRESKLTRILQDSLGGTSRSLMIACLNPVSYPEAVHTVSLAARSRKVVNFVGLASKKETPKTKVDMEAKLRAWLDSKGKTKSVQRKLGPCSASVTRTPSSTNHLKKPGSICSSAKDCSNTKGRLVLLQICITYCAILVDVFLFLNQNLPPCKEDRQQQSHLRQDNSEINLKEERCQGHMDILNNKNQCYPCQILFFYFCDVKRSSARKSNSHVIYLGSPFNKENLPFASVNTMGSSAATERIMEHHNTSRKVLSPLSSNTTSIIKFSSDDCTHISLEPKTPKFNYNKDDFGLNGTPLSKFNASSSNLKGIGQKRAEYILELREETPKPLKSVRLQEFKERFTCSTFIYH